jgi:hypothetical protein
MIGHVIGDHTPESEFAPPPGFSTGLDLSPRPFNGMAYEGVAEPFPDDMLVPRSEWGDRIEEIRKQGSGIKEQLLAAGIPVKDQNGTNYCVPGDTEVLTENGWVLWPEYNGTDRLATVNQATRELEFQAPTAVHVFDHDGPMIYSGNRSVDFAVTPNHRMYVRKWDESARRLSDSYTFQEAGDLGWYFGLMAAPSGFDGEWLDSYTIEGDRTYAGNDFIRLIALIASDGYAGGSESTHNWVSFCCFRADRLEWVRQFADRLGFTEKATAPGVFVRYSAGALADWIREHVYLAPDQLGSTNKKIPSLVKSLCGEQIELFLSAFGDKNHDRGNHYFSTSRRLIDDIQELLLRVGKRGSIWTDPATPHNDMHHLYVRSGDSLSIVAKKHLRTEHYTGKVYCATVPNSTLITRRNGSVLISGNCWINAPVFCVEITRHIQGDKHVSLSPASAGARIKNFRNSGGWGKEGLEFLAEHGVCPSAQWPDNAIRREHDTPANRELSKRYRVDEWWELEPRNLDHLVSAILRRKPVAVGYNWWRHEVTALGLVWTGSPENVQLLIGNSWSTQWGDKGYGTLEGRKRLPDDAVCPRSVLAS